ncbi:MAG: class I SAM-dependent methyltransferase [Candidatus Pacebacteria bacterium]|jgi:ubiquinone/menaquinone biosynthesis C-methylase UbiE|nr:class I SAM-dependent methyltransferase [Candidatus Paceibacterota bacterium]
MKRQSTSWESSAAWYQDLVEGQGATYQKEVILPNLLRVLALRKDEHLVDVACGQGFFTRAFAATGARTIGADISPLLIQFAKENAPTVDAFYIAPAHTLSFAKDASVDTITIIMAIQNIENPAEVVKECARVLRSHGRIVIVMNHPAFRIPKRSDWGYDEKTSTQYRRIDGYMSQSKVQIDMHPGKNATGRGSGDYTISFHNPLQFYFKLFHKYGFAVSRLEEWISHKKSSKGPRQKAEDEARKEIPIFLCLEVIKRNP